MEEIKRRKAEYRSSIRSKTLIKRAFIKMMQEKPFESITISELVKVADINRGTFYAHFKSTRDVLDRIQEDIINDLVGVLKKYSADEMFTNPLPCFQEISEFLAGDLEYYRLLFSTVGIPEYIRTNKERLFKWFLDSDISRVIEEKGMKEQFIGLLDFWGSAIINVYIDALLGNIPLNLSQIPDFCSRIVSAGNIAWFDMLYADQDI